MWGVGEAKLGAELLDEYLRVRRSILGSAPRP